MRWWKLILQQFSRILILFSHKHHSSSTWGKTIFLFCLLARFFSLSLACRCRRYSIFCEHKNTKRRKDFPSIYLLTIFYAERNFFASFYIFLFTISLYAENFIFPLYDIYTQWKNNIFLSGLSQYINLKLSSSLTEFWIFLASFTLFSIAFHTIRFSFFFNGNNFFSTSFPHNFLFLPLHS